jgi:hypothetical protein
VPYPYSTLEYRDCGCAAALSQCRPLSCRPLSAVSERRRGGAAGYYGTTSTARLSHSGRPDHRKLEVPDGKQRFACTARHWPRHWPGTGPGTGPKGSALARHWPGTGPGTGPASQSRTSQHLRSTERRRYPPAPYSEYRRSTGLHCALCATALRYPAAAAPCSCCRRRSGSASRRAARHERARAPGSCSHAAVTRQSRGERPTATIDRCGHAAQRSAPERAGL